MDWGQPRSQGRVLGENPGNEVDQNHGGNAHFWLSESLKSPLFIYNIIKIHVKAFLKEKQTQKKFWIFDPENHGLTPLEKWKIAKNANFENGIFIV